ncbi:hypothetical protein [Microbacterium sp. NPDC089188]|uniref:hypothetical protein n=1 Tax=Microbacterium sp. NPDC089188 TaxID=3154971 RepID=UPI00341731FE
MNDLKTLFGTSVEPGASQPGPDSSAAQANSLRSLVGESATNVPDAVKTNGLRDLVGAGAAESADSGPSLSAIVGASAPSTASRASDLTSLVGAASSSARSASPAADLSALVGREPGRRADEAGWRAPELAQVGRRPLFGGRRRVGAVNYFSVAAATLAVLTLVGTASFAVVQRATANPADEAMISLREREAELANETKVLQTAADLYAASVSEAASLADSSAPVLAGLSGRVDASVLASAESSRTALQEAAESAVPVSVPVYQRGAIDEKSLTDVGQAIDGVRLAGESLPPLVTDARDARSQVVAALAAFRTELKTVGTAIESSTAALLAANDSAGSAFRSAVSDAASKVAAAQQAGGDGLSEMTAFASAVDALRAEDARVRAIEEAERDAEPVTPTPRNPGSGTRPGDTSNPGGGSSSDGGTDPAPSPSPEPSQPSPEPSVEPTPEPSPTEESPGVEIPTVPSAGLFGVGL